MVALLGVLLGAVAEHHPVARLQQVLANQQDVGPSGELAPGDLLALPHEGQAVEKGNELLCGGRVADVIPLSPQIKYPNIKYYTSAAVQGARLHFNVHNLVQGSTYGHRAASGHIIQVYYPRFFQKQLSTRTWWKHTGNSVSANTDVFVQEQHDSGTGNG